MPTATRLHPSNLTRQVTVRLQQWFNLSDPAVEEAERAKNRTKSKVRARVEPAIGVIKRVFGFAKVRYRGLKKNTHRFVVTCALANLFMARRHLLRCQGV